VTFLCEIYRPRRKEKGGNGESKPGQKKLQHQLCNSDADPLTYAARSDYHYGAVAGLMSLNKSWIRICNVTKGNQQADSNILRPPLAVSQATIIFSLKAMLFIFFLFFVWHHNREFGRVNEIYCEDSLKAIPFP
jgi:hypothetical protein